MSKPSSPRHYRERIAFKVVWRVVLFSTLVTLFSTGLQLYSDYRKDIRAIDDLFVSIKGGYLKSIGQGVWILDDLQVQLQLEGIVYQRDVIYAAVIMDELAVWQSGVPARKNIRAVQYPLSIAQEEKQAQVGTLVVMTSLDGVYERLLQRVIIILVTNGIKTFLVAAFILLLFQHFVTRHLGKMAAFVGHQDVRHPQSPLQLERGESSSPDELDEVVDLINSMQKRACQAYRDMEESEQRLRFFFDSTEEGIFTVDQEGVCTFANAACRSIFGFSPEDAMLGQDIRSVCQVCLSDNDGAHFTDHVDTVLAEGRTLLVEEQSFRLPDGSCLCLFMRIYPLLEGEKINGAIVFLTDITMQQRLGEEKHLLAEALRQSPVAIILSDKSEQIQYVNPGFSRITGYSSSDVVGRQAYFFQDDLAQPGQSESIRKAFLAGQQWRGLLTNSSKSGAVFHLDTVVAPLCNQQGVITNFVAVGQDKTREMDLQAQLQHIQKLETIGKLSASIAHEFGNPLLGVHFAIREMKNKISLDEEERKMLDLAEEECDRMRVLIQDLQHLNRPTSGRKAGCDLNALLDHVLFFQKKFLKERHISLQKNYEQTLPEIIAVSDQIRQVVINLVINAAESMPDTGGRITISTATADESVTLTITDNGGGIAEEDLVHIFEPFFTTKGEAEGIGLGLAISYGIISSHGGTMNVKSKQDQGTSFIITLPIRQPVEEEPL